MLTKLVKAIRNPGKAIHYARRQVAPVDAEAVRQRNWCWGNVARHHLEELLPGIDQVDVTLRGPYSGTRGTSVDPNELLAIAALVRQLAPRKVLEIGTFDGNTTLNIAVNTPVETTIVTIDIAPVFAIEGFSIDVPDQHDNVTRNQRIGHRFLETEYAGRITQVIGDSAELDWDELGGPFDLIYIDGNHSYAYVVSDTKLALQHLAPNGAIVWHDYGEIYDVSRAVDEFVSTLEIAGIRGTRLAVGSREPLSDLVRGNVDK